MDALFFFSLSLSQFFSSFPECSMKPSLVTSSVGKRKCIITVNKRTLQRTVSEKRALLTSWSVEDRANKTSTLLPIRLYHVCSESRMVASEDNL
ncbi:hypothetical protein AVEN_160800-1 [Araneus ventricosus]|uniref:Secreted protein n=1 Tax=Araneus ventricosus TaxID=182803 RepID=A0A4Y2HP96_ARAVE|nr:hypothetical protein AVEN_160800-1 [Araneus ventricosus]